MALKRLLQLSLVVLLLALVVLTATGSDFTVTFSRENGPIDVDYDFNGLEAPLPRYELACEGGASGSCGGG